MERRCRNMSNLHCLPKLTRLRHHHRPHAQAYHPCLGTWKRNATLGVRDSPNLDKRVHLTFPDRGHSDKQKQDVDPRFFLSYLSSHDPIDRRGSTRHLVMANCKQCCTHIDVRERKHMDHVHQQLLGANITPGVPFVARSTIEQR